jgi:uncharacterized protein
MRILVSDIPPEGLDIEFEMPISLDEGGAEKNASVKLRVMKFGNRVLVEGKAGMTASLSCSRCLEDFSHLLEMDFSDEYLPDEETAEGSEHELSKEELNISCYSNDEIDLKELIKEQMLLVVPFKRLCKPDCKGLCPECGKDLNAGTCNCTKVTADPRLAKLGELKERFKK